MYTPRECIAPATTGFKAFSLCSITTARSESVGKSAKKHSLLSSITTARNEGVGKSVKKREEGKL
jgi:hypothetical protein